MGITLTTQPVQPGDFSGTAQEFGTTLDVRKVYGIKKGSLYNLHGQGKVRGKVLRVTGELKGIRLWDMQSIRKYIESQPGDFDDHNDNALAA